MEQHQTQLAAITPDTKVKWPIAMKLTVASTALVVLVVIAFAGTNIYTSSRDANDQKDKLQARSTAALNRVGVTIAQSLAQAAGPSILNDAYTDVEDSLEAAVKDPAILEAIWIDQRGYLRQGTSQARHSVPDVFKAPEKPGATDPPIHFNDPASLTYASQITVGSRSYGTVLVELSTDEMRKDLTEIDARASAARRWGLIRALVLGLVAVLGGAAISIFQGRLFTRPIQELMEMSDRVREGDLEARASKTTNDEVGVLSDRFNAMTRQLGILVHETAAKASLEKELDLAKKIQVSITPPRQTLQTPGLEFYGFCESADQCGGDWWHHYALPDGRTVLCIGDVTGHGVSSALLTASAKACCDTVMSNPQHFDIVHLMRTLDHVIKEAGKSELVMTFFASVIDPRTRTIKFANAGHNFPMIIRGGKASALVARGGRLGDGTDFAPVEQQLEPNDLLVYYTDGIIECENYDDEEYGMRRFRKYCRKNFQRSVEEITTGVVHEAYDFYAGRPADDDITLLFARLA